MTDCLLQGNKILWCGNGGSAAEAQHLAAELVGRFRSERRALPSIALTADTSVLTAIANDCGFAEVFDRQLEALCAPGDVVVGISTSGKSRNVCAALQRARELGAFTVAMTGETGGHLASYSDVCLRVASTDTARIQEGHLLLGHILCEWIELATCIDRAVATRNAGRCGVIADLREIVALVESGWRKVPALVVGDVMLDQYIWGEVERISPEAPVPVLRTGLAGRKARRRSQRRHEPRWTRRLRHGVRLRRRRRGAGPIGVSAWPTLALSLL